MSIRFSGIRQPGFTIIEVLIVMAVAALIILIVFLAVPALQRNERNVSRKEFANLAAAQMEEYYQHNNLNYPETPDQICDFIGNYLQAIDKGMGGCSPSYNGAKDCVLVTGGRFDICYHERGPSPHSYLGPEDELSIQLAHNCNPDQTGDPIISTGAAGDNDLKHYVLWIKLEGSRWCVDNFPD